MKQLRFSTTIVLTFLLCNAFAAPSGGSKKSLSKEQTERALLLELTGKDQTKETDTDLYAQMVSFYNEENEIAFKSRLQSLLSRFPQSPFADNALYLAGHMAVARKNYAEAIKYFAKIEKDYPRSNKIIAAKFAKAMTYKRMNLPQFAARSLKEVRSKYMGSPESFRADTELKIIKL